MRITLTVVSILSLILPAVTGTHGGVAAAEKGAEQSEVCLISVQDIPRMSVDELKSRLDDPSLVLIDVRSPSDWNAGPTKIKGAYRETLDKIDDWAARYDRGKNVVLYCS